MFEEINLETPGNHAPFVSSVQEIEPLQSLQNKQLISIVESISQMVLILNQQHQIVYANKNYCDFFNAPDLKFLIGKKTGETIVCRNAIFSNTGCGTTPFCKSCGVSPTIVQAIAGIRSTRECTIRTPQNETYDLKVTASPLEFEGERLTLFSIIDISHEKRRRSLERVFIHDIMNIAGGISGLSTILKEINDLSEIHEIGEIIEGAAQNLIDEIQVQREISSAERGDLTIHNSEIQTFQILTELKKLYSNHETNNGKPLVITKFENHCVTTDRVLLKRILGNMIKNALEADQSNDEISLSCIRLQNKVRFKVHNNSVIPEEIKSELFKRFYSTKQNGRGIGTYSMKLFGEKYLKGKVWFSSSPENGTSFYFELKI